MFGGHAARSAGRLRGRYTECGRYRSGDPFTQRDDQAEGDLDFRGTLGVSKDAPVGFKEIRLYFDLDTDATDEQVATLIRLAERYCVVYQTLSRPATISVLHRVISR